MGHERLSNPVKTYLDLLHIWRERKMPDAMLTILDRAWSALSDTEKQMAAKLIGWELKYGTLRDDENKDA